LLLLFDIDGTLIRTRGAGMRALEDAAREAHGPHLSAAGIDFAGALDPIIIARMLAAAGIEPTPAALAAVRERYPAHLARHLAARPAHPRGSVDPDTTGALPGVHDLLRILTTTRPHYTLGLLTGNLEEGARLKLAHCGIDHDAFTIRVYGDDSPHAPPLRHHLTPIAIDRHHQSCGLRLAARHVLIIGDTAHDIACATTHGARSLGVTTGGHTRAQLQAAGADRVVDTLQDTASLLQWIDRLSEQAE
jgi:phosphoglycolate phosphatase-like HAD superfamily hydrolase